MKTEYPQPYAAIIVYRSVSMRKILFTGGGSAGHVIPNVALMEELISNGKADVCYMGTDGIEKSIVAEWKIPYYQISCPKLIRGGGLKAFKQNLAIPFAFRRAVQQARKGLEVFRPDVVFSKGGYVALPVVFAAKKLGIPCYAHESDYSIGLANKLSASKCRKIFTSFPETATRLKRGEYSGAPIRRSVFIHTRAEARKTWDIGLRQTVVLIFGGGSGSKAINEAVRKQLKRLTERYVILHVCGKGNVIDCNVKNYIQTEFIQDMGSAYACADVVVSRAGAGTVFELLALKKPSLLIPLAGQTRGDQAENAAYFQSKGLCRVLNQSRLHLLADEIEQTVLNDGLKTRLQNSSFTSGNRKILQTLLQEL